MRRNLTIDIGLRMYKQSPLLTQGGEASVFSFERFDPKWGGKPPLLYQPTLQAGARKALNTVTGEVLPPSFIGLMIPGTGLYLRPHHQGKSVQVQRRSDPGRPNLHRYRPWLRE